MRRVLLVAAASLLLGGCENSGNLLWYDDHAPAAAFPDAPAAASRLESAAIPSEIQQVCESAAVSRAAATADQGFDPAVQQSVHEDVYADCVKWRMR
jgi:hypothetical protein